MAGYLKIENPGVAPSESFTLLGASTKRGSDNSKTIGKFGSGNKHGIAVCLRNSLAPVVFAGNLKMEFATRPQVVDDGIRKSNFNRVVVKFGGKDEDGKSRTSTEDLGYVLEYGSADWNSVSLALREFVSNAIDRAIEQGEHDFAAQWVKDNPGKWVDGTFPDPMDRDEFATALKKYRETATDYKNVTVSVVEENQVRAKSGTTRVFVPLTADVLEFYNNLGKWFLHFSEPESLHKTILPKRNRNLGDRKAAVIYRRGVRVREFESSDVPSLFDYNLENLELDEARKVDDWRVRNSAGQAMIDGGADVLAAVLQSFSNNKKVWEHEFDNYALEPSWRDTPEKLAARETVWKDTFDKVFGLDSVIATADGGETAARKGYKVVNAPAAFVSAAGKYGVRTPEKVLTQDDRDGREVLDATPDATAAVDWVWSVVEGHGMTNGKAKPPVKCFRQIMQGGAQTLGFYRNGVVYFNTDIAGYGTLEGGLSVLSQQLLTTALEELAHYVTEAGDNSRDFQDYVLNLAVKIAKSNLAIKLAKAGAGIL